MDINATAAIDVGPNLTELLQQLATQIGVTADKVFPWYIKQQVIDGWTTGAALLMALFIAAAFTLLLKKHTSAEDRVYGSGLYPITTCFIFITFIILLVGMYSAPSVATKIMNPEYHATQALVSDLAKLRPSK